MGHKKNIVLLIQLGSPKSWKVKDVYRYLSEFLNDPRVIDLPPWQQKLLVNGLIVPFRAPRSAKVYKQLYEQSQCFPLTKYTHTLTEKLNHSCHSAQFYYAMRYGEPSIDKVLREISYHRPKKLIIFPLFPQYASSTIGTAYEKIMKVIAKWWVIPETFFIGHYPTHKQYLKGYIEKGKKLIEKKSWDYFLFSFHGLPIRHLKKNYPEKPCPHCACELSFNEDNYYCYKAACYATARAIATALCLPENKWKVGFQSRLGKDPWIQPYAENILVDLAKQNIKNILVFSPSFTADCLETSIEIATEYKKLFQENGGENLTLVESLNDNEEWVKAIMQIIQPYL